MHAQKSGQRVFFFWSLVAKQPFFNIGFFFPPPCSSISMSPKLLSGPLSWKPIKLTGSASLQSKQGRHRLLSRNCIFPLHQRACFVGSIWYHDWWTFQNNSQHFKLQFISNIYTVSTAAVLFPLPFTIFFHSPAVAFNLWIQTHRTRAFQTRWKTLSFSLNLKEVFLLQMQNRKT